MRPFSFGFPRFRQAADTVSHIVTALDSPFATLRFPRRVPLLVQFLSRRAAAGCDVLLLLSCTCQLPVRYQSSNVTCMEDFPQRTSGLSACQARMRRDNRHAKVAVHFRSSLRFRKTHVINFEPRTRHARSQAAVLRSVCQLQSRVASPAKRADDPRAHLLSFGTASGRGMGRSTVPHLASVVCPQDRWALSLREGRRQKQSDLLQHRARRCGGGQAGRT